jgi:uncharacterized membrane protein
MPVALLFIILIGLLLRIYNLAKLGFWFDEAVCLHHAIHFFKDIVTIYVKKNVSDGVSFIILLKSWMVFFHSDYFIKLLPVICGVISIIVIYYVGELIFSRKAGLMSALLLSISPLYVYYSQELTYYSLSVSLALASTYYMLRLLNKWSRKWSIFYLITTLGIIYNHPISVLFLFVQNLFFYSCYYKDKSLRKKWLRLQLIIFSFTLPWLGVISFQFLQFTKLSIFFWVPKPNIGSFLQTFMIFSLGYHASWARQLIALFIFLIFSGWAIFYWRKNKEIIYLIFWLIMPPVIMWLISQFHPFYLHRIFIFSLPAFYLLIAAGITTFKKYLALGLLAPCLILISFSLFNYYKNELPPDYKKRYIGVWSKKDYKRAALYISNNFQEGDVILHICRSTFMPFIYYHKQQFPEYGVELNGICNKDWIIMFGNLPINNYSKTPQPAMVSIRNKGELGKYKRVWLVQSFWEWEGLAYLPEYDELGNSMVGWFNEKFSKLDMQMFNGANIYLYSFSDK